ncbi:hypothetical protein ACFUTU_09260 [Arthrobacter sp. NPDC057388]|uniref:hypothetical protein n=1 Tax=Arthrobacter sp. NPDC057388 TaxID=3346116 RepID=UPI00363FE3C4
MAVRAVVAKTFATTASILFAGLVGAWFAIKIKQSADLAVPAWSQAFRVTTATVLLAPFLALIFLCAKPRLVFKQDPWWGSLFFAGLAFVWLLCALFLSVFVGFGGF